MLEVELDVPAAPPSAPPAPPAPAANKPDLDPIKALELLRAGKIVENVRISRLKLRGAFDAPVRFRKCVLVQCEFENVTFNDEVAFTTCMLDRPSFSKQVVFEKSFDLSHSVVDRTTFSKVKVKGKFTAAYVVFRGRLAFNDCVFEKAASFWEAKFETWADIKGCKFHDCADFRSIHAEQGFVIARTTFHGDFLFRGACVEKKFEADKTRFEKKLDLSKAKLRDFAYLEGIEQGADQTFAFVNAVAERIRIRPEQLAGRLDSEAAGRFEESMQEYGLLKRCYQTLHRFDDEDWAFYQFKICQRKAKRRVGPRPWAALRTWTDWLFLDVGCAYGTSPTRAVRMGLIIILCFAAVYAARPDLFYAEKLPFDGPKEAIGNRLMVGLIASVSVFTSGMGGIREVAKGWMNVPVMIESIMGTLLFGLFIVAFSRKVIR